MLPKFPKFKKLELSDRKDIEKITSKFLPFSDFNFVSMWSWDLKGDMRISHIHGNLVVKFNDYITDEPFLSFIGNKNINGTIDALLTIADAMELGPTLKLIPEICISGLDESKYIAVEDRNHFDYIYDLNILKEMAGNKLRNKRNQANNFIKKYPHSEIRILQLGDKETQAHIIKLYKIWISNKSFDKNFSIVEHKEIEVIRRLFNLNKEIDLMTVGIFIDNELKGFLINELTNESFNIGLIAKADTSFKGIYEYLRLKNAEIVFSFNKSFMNDEQDLGLDSLRISKSQFKPVKFFKKFIVSTL